MIQQTYSLRAFSSRASAEAGEKPKLVSSTGNYTTAQIYAKSYASEYGSCVVENKETGNRVWF